MSARKKAPQTDAQQEQLLTEAKQMVESQAWQMKRALDGNDIMEALKHASNMISELRTGLLSPRSYYALYLLTTGHLRQLELYITEGRHGRQLHELYELVQYAGNILPRLYLLTTVGSVFMKSLQVPAKEVLYDLVELCRGVQHPTRGLFLRTYLSEMTKDTLPDEGLKFEGEVTDAIDFVVTNFTEMNKLWVRMQHSSGPARDQVKREQEREDLNILVGKNLSRLSQLEGLTIGIYKSDVLPRLLDQIVKCEDRIAQQYLMVILIQAFSDDFHLRTLDQLLLACQKMVDDVEVHLIVSSLIDRLANYCAGKPEASVVTDDTQLFDLFSKYISDLARARTNMALASVIEMANAMLNLAQRVYKDDKSKVDYVYEFTFSHMQERSGTGDKKVTEQCTKLLQIPIEHNKSIRSVLQLKNYGKVLNALPWADRRKMALFLVDSAIKNETKIPTPEEVETLLGYLAPLIKRDLGGDSFSDEDWHEDQMKVSYILSMFFTPDVEVMYAILRKAHDLLKENVNIRGRYTLVPLSFKALKLVQSIYKAKDKDEVWEKKAKLVLKFVNDAVTAIKGEESHLAFNLYLECAIAAGKMGLSQFAYSFLTKGALALYEDETMAQSQLEFDAIRQLIATIDHLVCFETEEYEKLAKRIAQHASKLVVVDFQSRATVLAAHLFMSGQGGSAGHEFKDPKSSLQCLKKAMQIAGGVTEPEAKTALFVELLDHYLWFFDKYTDVAEAVYVNAIIDKIKKQVVSDDLEAKGHSCLAHFKNIKENVLARQNWQTYLKQAPSGKNPTTGEAPVEVAKVGLDEEKARVEAERWKQIQF